MPSGTPQPVQDACNNFNNVFGIQAAWSRKITVKQGTVGDPDVIYQCRVVLPTSESADAFFDSGGHPAEVDGKSQVFNTFTGGTQSYSKSEVECAIASGRFSFQSCIWFPLMSWLGSWFLTVNGFLVWVAGGLFDTLVEHVIAGFGTTLKELNITPSIERGWTVFRDVGNIVIIGMFAFIALSMIAGLKTYGDKKLVANLLIIAVLINFSLLFTRMIVDFSNFTALQFYKQIEVKKPDGTNGGISWAFLKPMGITNIWDTQCLTKAAGGQPCQTNAAAIASGETSGWRAFVYGLVGGALLAGVWFVLFYGSFHIAARAITIIFLMLTAAIAFATYLVPKLSQGDYGWKAWWGALINSAIFAPLLMIFLFISLLILKGTEGIVGAGSVNISTFITDPSNSGANAWQAIFIYIIVIGLLFASIKISAKVSSGLGGSLLGGALGLAGTVLTGGLGLAARFGIAPIARRYIGAPALARADKRGDQAKTAMESMRTATSRSDRNAFAYQALRRRSQEARNLRIADSKMNVMDTAPMKSLTSQLGLKGILSGQSSKDTLSFAGKTKRDLETMSKLAESIRPNADDLRQKKRQEIYDSHKDEYDYKLKRQKDMAAEYEAGKNQLEFLGRNATETKKHQDKVIEAIQQVAVANGSVPAQYSSDLETIKKYDDSRNGWKDELAKVIKDAGKEQQVLLQEKLNDVGEATSADHLKNIEKEILKAVPENMRATVTQQLNESKGSHESEMRHESSRIEAARKHAADLADSDNVVKGLIPRYDESKQAAAAEFAAVTNAREAKRIASNQATRDLGDFVKGVRFEVQQAEKGITQSVLDVMPDVAEAAADRARPWFRRRLITTKAEQVAEEKLVKDLKKKQKQKLGQNVFAGYEERGGGGSGEGGTPPKTT